MNHLKENNDVFKVEEGVGAYSNYQKYGIEGYHSFVGKGKDSPHFLSALKEAQESTKRKQSMYLDAMINSPFFLEKYFGKINLPYIQDQINSYISPFRPFSKPEYVAALDSAYSVISNDEHNKHRITEYIKNQVVTAVKTSKRFESQQKKQEKEILDINKQGSRNGLVRAKKEIGVVQSFYNDALKSKIEEFYEKKGKDIDKRRNEYCKAHFLKEAEKKVCSTMYSPMEMVEYENIKKWLEGVIVDIKIEDRTDEIVDPSLTYNGEKALTTISFAQSLLTAKDILKDHLFNLLIEIVEVKYYQALLKQSPSTKNLIVKKPPFIDDIQSGSDFIVIDPNNKNSPYTSYDLKTTMNKSTIANSVTANKYDKGIVKHVLKNADAMQELKDADPENDLLNEDLKIRKKRPLWGMYAATGQIGPIDKFVVKKDILGFPSNLAYTLLSSVMAKVSKGHTINDDEILHLVNENNQDFQDLTTYMQDDIAKWNRLIHINQSCSNIAKSGLFDVLSMKRTG